MNILIVGDETTPKALLKSTERAANLLTESEDKTVSVSWTYASGVGLYERKRQYYDLVLFVLPSVKGVLVSKNAVDMLLHLMTLVDDVPVVGMYNRRDARDQTMWRGVEMMWREILGHHRVNSHLLSPHQFRQGNFIQNLLRREVEIHVAARNKNMQALREQGVLATLPTESRIAARPAEGGGLVLKFPAWKCTASRP